MRSVMAAFAAMSLMVVGCTEQAGREGPLPQEQPQPEGPGGLNEEFQESPNREEGQPAPSLIPDTNSQQNESDNGSLPPGEKESAPSGQESLPPSIPDDESNNGNSRVDPFDTENAN